LSSVREPAGADRADEIEDAHHGEHTRGTDGGQAEIRAERDEMGLDQAVGAGAADKEGREQGAARGRAHARVLDPVRGGLPAWCALRDALSPSAAARRSLRSR
jgi:hypothetical protein